MSLPIILKLETAEQSNDEIFSMLSSYNKKMLIGYHDPIAFSLYIKDGSITMGGATGKIWLDSIHIDRLIVDDQIRGLGYGIKLIQQIELCGRENGATFISLENISFQNSLGFYLKNGFTIILEEKGYKDDSIIYHLRKPMNP